MPTDEEIEARLNSLKEYVKKLNPQQEIEERLARLTNRDPSYYSANNRPIHLILPQKRLTDEESTDALLQNVMQELSIDEQRSMETNEFESIANQKLKNIRQFTNKLPSSSTVQRILIDEPECSNSIEEDNDVDNWCTTCNEDATIICRDCDDDKYCSECYRELHRDRDMRGHRTTALHKK